jgi:peptidyl-dipeptidase Dcp
MKSLPVKSILGAAVLAALSVAASSTAVAAPSSDASRTPAMTDNPFQRPSSLAFQLPPFDKIKDSDYRPAYEAGMKEELDEVARIASNPAAPTFENTIVALERNGRLLQRVDTVFSALNQCNTNDEMQKIDTEMSPKLSAHEDAISLNPALFARVDALYKERASLKLDPESLQLLERYHIGFVRAGAGLPDPAKAQLRKLNEQLAALTTQFKQNVLKATKEHALVIDSADELKGLSSEQIGAAASAATARGLTGKWVLTLQNTTISRCSNACRIARFANACIARRSSAERAVPPITPSSSRRS